MFNDVEKLIVLVTAVEATFTLLSVAGLLWMRRTHPKLQRPIRVSLILPIVYLFVCTFIIIFSCFKQPVILGFGIIFIVIGFPMYYVFIWREKPRWFQSACNSFNLMCSKLFMCLPEDSKELWSLILELLLIWLFVIFFPNLIDCKFLFKRELQCMRRQTVCFYPKY